MDKVHLNLIWGCIFLVLVIFCPARGQFNIFMPKDKITMDNVKIITQRIPLAMIELRKNPIVAEVEIISYATGGHVLELKGEAYQRIIKLKAGMVVVICSGRKPIYWAVMWNDILSVACSDVVILRQGRMYGDDTPPHPATVSIECGYPSKEWFRGQDPRNNEELMARLRWSGKLK